MFILGRRNGKKSAVIRNKDGIHVRPSTVIFKEFKDYEGDISIKANKLKGNLTVMSLLSMGLVKGTKVDIKVSGSNEENICKKVKTYFEKIYDFQKEN